ncbi:hypothetical protein CV632_03900, partial [Geobacillus thermodenitrificans]|uniref:hypothetical protein n=2 Tax=Geobacillus thermodenitrificans TaxID=33940 RepID=UPI000CBEC996
LGTPPAFVLSQDQTLQKKVDWLALRFVQFSRNELTSLYQLPRGTQLPRRITVTFLLYYTCLVDVKFFNHELIITKNHVEQPSKFNYIKKVFALSRTNFLLQLSLLKAFIHFYLTSFSFIEATLYILLLHRI